MLVGNNAELSLLISSARWVPATALEMCLEFSCAEHIDGRYDMLTFGSTWSSPTRLTK